MVAVSKHNGKVKVCIDFTNLNDVYPKDSYPLPSIDKLVSQTVGHEMFSLMDDYSGYNQIKLVEEDQEKTTFITEDGL